MPRSGDRQYAENDGESEPLLREAGRQAREDETLFLRDSGG